MMCALMLCTQFRCFKPHVPAPKAVAAPEFQPPLPPDDPPSDSLSDPQPSLPQPVPPPLLKLEQCTSAEVIMPPPLLPPHLLRTLTVPTASLPPASMEPKAVAIAKPAEQSQSASLLKEMERDPNVQQDSRSRSGEQSFHSEVQRNIDLTRTGRRSTSPASSVKTETQSRRNTHHSSDQQSVGGSGAQSLSHSNRSHKTTKEVAHTHRENHSRRSHSPSHRQRSSSHDVSGSNRHRKKDKRRCSARTSRSRSRSCSRSGSQSTSPQRRHRSTTDCPRSPSRGNGGGNRYNNRSHSHDRHQSRSPSGQSSHRYGSGTDPLPPQPLRQLPAEPTKVRQISFPAAGRNNIPTKAVVLCHMMAQQEDGHAQAVMEGGAWELLATHEAALMTHLEDEEAISSRNGQHAGICVTDLQVGVN